MRCRKKGEVYLEQAIKTEILLAKGFHGFIGGDDTVIEPGGLLPVVVVCLHLEPKNTLDNVFFKEKSNTKQDKDKLGRGKSTML